MCSVSVAYRTDGMDGTDGMDDMDVMDGIGMYLLGLEGNICLDKQWLFLETD